MDKIFEMLGVEKLDESKQAELKETLRTVIELKAQEIAESKVDELVEEKKNELVEQYEEKFEMYKDSITSKFSNFVDNVLDEEMAIPDKVLKYAKLGELYHDLIEQFKVRLAIDEGVISDEIKGLLKEAREEITSLREKLDENTGKVLELEADASEMAAQLYIRQKCDGLTESQKNKVIALIGDEIVKENIDAKFDTIMESLNLLSEGDNKDDDNDGDASGDNDDDGDGDGVFEAVCSECGNTETVKEDDDMTCPECGGTMKITDESKKVKKTKKTKKKKGMKESKDSDSNDFLGESLAWETYKNIWIDALKTEE